MRKKIFIISMFLILPFFVAGCGAEKKPVNMNELDQAGVYNYKNQDLGFSLTLPKEFEYYQTQRLNDPASTDIEIFVPTSDRTYAQEVEGYAKPLVVKIFEKSNTEAINAELENMYARKVSETGEKVYFIEKWKSVPADWKEKWTDAMEENIYSSFKNI